jgi:hypothetical protein
MESGRKCSGGLGEGEKNVSILYRLLQSFILHVVARVDASTIRGFREFENTASRTRSWYIPYQLPLQYFGNKRALLSDYSVSEAMIANE